MDKKLIIVLVLAVAVAALWLGGWRPSLNGGRSTHEGLAVQEYSISAEVIAVERNSYTVRAAKLMLGLEGNYVGFEEKKFKVGKATLVRKLTNRNGDILIADAAPSDIAVGQNVTLYASVDMASKDSFTPSRVDIQL